MKKLNKNIKKLIYKSILDFLNFDSLFSEYLSLLGVSPDPFLGFILSNAWLCYLILTTILEIIRYYRRK